MAGFMENIGNIGSLNNVASSLLPTKKGESEGTNPLWKYENDVLIHTEENWENYKEYLNNIIENRYIKPLNELGSDTVKNLICHNIVSYLDTDKFRFHISQLFTEKIEIMVEKGISSSQSIQTGGNPGIPPLLGSAIGLTGPIIPENIEPNPLDESEVIKDATTKIESIQDIVSSKNHDLSEDFLQKIVDKIEEMFSEKTKSGQVNSEFNTSLDIVVREIKKLNESIEDYKNSLTMPLQNGGGDNPESIFNFTPDSKYESKSVQESYKESDSKSYKEIDQESDSKSYKETDPKSYKETDPKSYKESYEESDLDSDSKSGLGSDSKSGLGSDSKSGIGSDSKSYKESEYPKVYSYSPAVVPPDKINSYIMEQIFNKTTEIITQNEESIKRDLTTAYLHLVTKFVTDKSIMQTLIEDKIHLSLVPKILEKMEYKEKLKYLNELLFGNRRDSDILKQIIENMDGKIDNLISVSINAINEPLNKLSVMNPDELQSTIKELFVDSSMIIGTKINDINYQNTYTKKSFGISDDYVTKDEYKHAREIFDFAYDPKNPENNIYKNTTINKEISDSGELELIPTVETKVNHIFENMVNETTPEFNAEMRNSLTLHIQSIVNNCVVNRIILFYRGLFQDDTVTSFLQGVILKCLDKYQIYKTKSEVKRSPDEANEEIEAAEAAEDRKLFKIFILYGIYYSLHKYLFNSYQFYKDPIEHTTIIGNDAKPFTKDNGITFHVNIDRLYENKSKDAENKLKDGMGYWSDFVTLVPESSTYLEKIRSIVDEKEYVPSPSFGGKKTRQKRPKKYTSKKRDHKKKYTQYRKLNKTAKKRPLKRNRRHT
jgi:hypothetical protein